MPRKNLFIFRISNQIKIESDFNTFQAIIKDQTVYRCSLLLPTPRKIQHAIDKFEKINKGQTVALNEWL